MIILLAINFNFTNNSFHTFGEIHSGEFKGSRMGHSVKASLWYVTLLINTRFRFFF